MAPDEACELLRAASTRQNSDFHLGQAEFCALPRDDNVCTESEFEAAAEREAFNGSNQRLWTIHDRPPVLLNVSRHDFNRTGIRHLTNVGAGGKRSVRACYNDAADGVLAATARDLVGKACAQIEVECVTHLRT